LGAAFGFGLAVRRRLAVFRFFMRARLQERMGEVHAYTLGAAEGRGATRPPLHAASFVAAICDGSFIGNRYAAG
jgi:hypothetical protein